MTSTYLTLPTISHSLLNLTFLTAAATTLPRRSTQVCYIYLHSSSTRHILLDISDTLKPSNPRYSCAIHSTTADTEATGKKPPPCRTGMTLLPRSIGQEATARWGTGPTQGPPAAARQGRLLQSPASSSRLLMSSHGDSVITRHHHRR